MMSNHKRSELILKRAKGLSLEQHLSELKESGLLGSGDQKSGVETKVIKLRCKNSSSSSMSGTVYFIFMIYSSESKSECTRPARFLIVSTLSCSQHLGLKNGYLLLHLQVFQFVFSQSDY